MGSEIRLLKQELPQWWFKVLWKYLYICLSLQEDTANETFSDLTDLLYIKTELWGCRLGFICTFNWQLGMLKLLSLQPYNFDKANKS